MNRNNLLYIFQTGYGLVSLPLSLFSFATTIYYLLVNNVAFLKDLFPQFWMFLVVGGLTGFPVIMLLGWIFIKSELNKASTRTHPFSNLLIPTQIPMYRAVSLLSRERGFTDVADSLDALIKESVEKW